MGLNVAAVDIDDDKLAFAKSLGASVVANARNVDPGRFFHQEFGGAHGVLVTAVSPKAFEQATTVMRRGGTMVLNGLPPGSFDLSIFNMVLEGTTVRGSIVGTRKDLQEALDFAGRNKVAATISVEPLDQINDIFGRMREGKITGRVVVDMSL
jgi:propanol-preferring alcohol dehydrogenase